MIEKGENNYIFVQALTKLRPLFVHKVTEPVDTHVCPVEVLVAYQVSTSPAQTGLH